MNRHASDGGDGKRRQKKMDPQAHHYLPGRDEDGHVTASEPGSCSPTRLQMHAQHETILLLHFKIIQCWMGRTKSIRRATHDRRTTKNDFHGGVLVTGAARL